MSMLDKSERVGPQDARRDGAAPAMSRPVSNKRGAYDFDRFFRDRLDSLKAEGRYRVFAELARQAGRFPVADMSREVRAQSHARSPDTGGLLPV